jgi:predicted dehydrogenase
MNILILGLGSVGQRHLRNLSSMYKKINFYTVRKKRITPTLSKNNKVLNNIDLEKKYKIKNFNSLNEIKKNKINIFAALICTPSSRHADEAIWCINNNIHVFIEKPMCTNQRQLLQLIKAQKKNKNIISMIGYQLRFNPIINFIKNFVEKNKEFGRIYSAYVHHGEHIADFHKYENYQISYAANKSLGGGVVLTQIHEIDYIQYIFSNYKLFSFKSVVAKLSSLKINVEDFYSAIILFIKKKHKIIVNLTCNYFERPKKRIIHLIGSNGSLEADLNLNFIKYNINGRLYEKKFKIDRNLIFKNEIKYFISLIENRLKSRFKHQDILKENKNIAIALKIKKNPIKN